MSKNKQQTYSQALTELEKIIAEIESENIDLDQLAEKVKRASQLIKFCRQRLRSTEEDVKTVLAEMEDKTAAGEDVEENS